MKKTIARICIWILRKLKVSCIIGMKILPENQTIRMQGKNYYTYWYDCDLTNCKFYTIDNQEFIIPGKEKFEFIHKSK